MHKLLLVLSFLFLAVPLTLNAQNSKQKLNEAKEFFYHEKYTEALTILKNSRKLSRSDKEARLLIAVCHYQLNELDIARALLEEITAEKKDPYPECWLYLGKVLHAMHQFTEAADYYKLYLRTIRPDHHHRKMVREEIRRCANGIDVQFRQSLAIVENLGNNVNTKADEFAPVPSRNLSDKLYFTSIRYGNAGGPRDEHNKTDERYGHFLSDMYSCQITNGQWGNATSMHYLLNSPQNEVLLDFNRDGSVMYYFKGWTDLAGEIVADTFKTEQNRRLNSTPFLGPLNVANGDNDLVFYNDTVVIFSSRRPDGYGGYDLYKAVFKNGYWGEPRNLGPAINTAYDEISPYLAPDGKSLFFSSNDSRKSIGGFDVFKTVYVAQTGEWSEPFNIGIPINSAGDDTGFRLTRDGFTAFFASSRKDGEGLRDLYIAYFKEYLKEVEPEPVKIVAKPVEYNRPPADNKPSFSIKEDPFEEQPEPPKPAPTPVAPPKKKELKPAKPVYAPIFFKAKGTLDFSKKKNLDPVADLLFKNPGLTVIVSAYSMDEGSVPQRLFDAMSMAEKVGEYLMSRGVPAKAIYMRAMDGSELNNNNSFAVELSFIGTEEIEGNKQIPEIGHDFKSMATGFVTNNALFYKVQISSATKALKRSILDEESYPMIEKTPDFAYYRYTLGAFRNYEEAKSFSRAMQRKGQKGAYVVPFIKGKRADKNEAKRNTGNYPDLENYLRG